MKKFVRENMNEESPHPGSDHLSDDQIEAINMLADEGLEFISTPRQIKNGTLMFRDTKLKNIKYSITASGYARRHVPRRSYANDVKLRGSSTVINKRRTKGAYTQLSSVLRPGDYSGLADDITRVVDTYRNRGVEKDIKESDVSSKENKL